MVERTHKPLHHWLEVGEVSAGVKLLRRVNPQAAEMAVVNMPTYPVETGSSLTTMLMLKEDNPLVALMASPTMDFCMEHGIARRLPIRFKTRHEGFGIATRKGAQLSPAASLLVECMRQTAERRRHPA